MKFKFFLLLLVMACWFAFASIGFAATTNPATGTAGYIPVVFKFNSYTASRTGIASWKAPTGYTIKHASVTVRAVAGTNPTMKLRGKDGTFLRYSTTVSAAGTKDMSLTATPTITDETQQSIDLIAGGTSPVFSDITVLLFLRQN